MNKFDPFRRPKYSKVLAKWKQSNLELGKITLCENDPVGNRYIVSYEHPIYGKIFGYGEDESKCFAKLKAINELLERECCFENKKRFGKLSSNGVASHENQRKSSEAAIRELLERDAFLRHWLTKTPFDEDVTKYNCIRSFINYLSGINHKLKILSTNLSSIDVKIALIINQETGGFIVGTAYKKYPEESVYKAVSEAFYTLHIVRLSNKNDWADGLINHARYWYHHQVPSWFFQKKVKKYSKISLKPEVIELSRNPTYITKAVCKDAIQLWVGKDVPSYVFKYINKSYSINANLEPHPLP